LVSSSDKSSGSKGFSVVGRLFGFSISAQLGEGVLASLFTELEMISFLSYAKFSLTVLDKLFILS
jgi:hypothetical protein